MEPIIDPDRELEELEASMQRRKQVARAFFLAVALAPVFVVGYCVKQMLHTEPPRQITLSADEQRSVREVARAHARNLDVPIEFVAPAAILEQLRTAQPAKAACPIALRARSADIRTYEPPTFELTQLSEAELAAATPGTPAERSDDIEVIFIATHRRDAHSNGMTFTPGEVGGRAYIWQHSTNAIVCAGDIIATSSSDVAVQRTTVGGERLLSTGSEDIGVLRADLDRRLERAIAIGMHTLLH